MSENNDTSTVTGAQGLLKHLDDFRLIINLHIIDAILKITGPCSRIFQAKSADLPIAVSTVTACKAILQEKRQDRMNFDKILSKAKEFSQLHDINAVLTHHGKRKIRKRYADGSTDDSVQSQPKSKQIEEEDDIYISITHQLSTLFCRTYHVDSKRAFYRSYMPDDDIFCYQSAKKRSLNSLDRCQPFLR